MSITEGMMWLAAINIGGIVGAYYAVDWFVEALFRGW